MGTLKQPSPSTKPTSHPVVKSLSCWFSALPALSLPSMSRPYERGGTFTTSSKEIHRVFQHIADCAPRSHLRGGQLPPACWGISYLRTLIVRAAVYRGLGSELRLAANPSP